MKTGTVARIVEKGSWGEKINKYQIIFYCCFQKKKFFSLWPIRISVTQPIVYSPSLLPCSTCTELSFSLQNTIYSFTCLMCPYPFSGFLPPSLLGCSLNIISSGKLSLIALSQVPVIFTFMIFLSYMAFNKFLNSFVLH